MLNDPLTLTLAATDGTLSAADGSGVGAGVVETLSNNDQTLTLAGSTSGSYSGIAMLDTPVSGVNAINFVGRPVVGSFTGRARVVVFGSSLVTRSCSVSIADAGGFSLGGASNILDIKTEDEIQFTNSFSQFTGTVPRIARGTFTCLCA